MNKSRLNDVFDIFNSSWKNLQDYPTIQKKFIKLLTECIVYEYLDLRGNGSYWCFYFMDDCISFIIEKNYAIVTTKNIGIEDSMIDLKNKSHRIEFNDWIFEPLRIKSELT